MKNLSILKLRKQKSRTGAFAKGFTLIEIMIVLVIMGILAGLVVPKLMGRTDDARVLQAKQDISTMLGALKMYKLDNLRYPTTEQGLQALITKGERIGPSRPLHRKRIAFAQPFAADTWLSAICRRWPPNV